MIVNDAAASRKAIVQSANGGISVNMNFTAGQFNLQIKPIKTTIRTRARLDRFDIFYSPRTGFIFASSTHRNPAQCLLVDKP